MKIQKKKFPYQRHEKIDNVDAYVVRIYNSINYDIDLQLSSAVMSKYKNLTTNIYKYTDDEGVSHQSMTYRCRLEGVGIRDQDRRSTFRDYLYIIQMINKHDGWVKCSVGDVDVYGRLLIRCNLFYNCIQGRPGYQVYNDPAPRSLNNHGDVRSLNNHSDVRSLNNHHDSSLRSLNNHHDPEGKSKIKHLKSPSRPPGLSPSSRPSAQYGKYESNLLNKRLSKTSRRISL